MKKILLLSGSRSIFTDDLLQQLQQSHEFDATVAYYPVCLFKTKIRILNLFGFAINTLVFLTRMFFSKKYDIINVHFVSPIYPYIAFFIRKKCKALIVSVWGSDFNKATDAVRKKLSKVFSVADIITFTNQALESAFHQYYSGQYQGKTKVIRFGLRPLPIIRQLLNKESKESIKQYFKINPDLIVVTCGTNASKAQQHDEIIKALSKLPKKIIEKCFFIFPLTYGHNVLEVAKHIRKTLDFTKLRYRLLTQYPTNEDNARLRIISDVLIQVQTDDQLSGAMTETLFSGNIVITGKWLPYDVFDQIGVELLKVSQIEEISKLLPRVVEEHDKFYSDDYKKKSRNAIWEFASWEKNFNLWLNLYK